MGVKTVKCPIAEISVLMRELLQEFNSFSIYAAGSREHREAGLRDDYVLIRAWKYSPRPHLKNAARNDVTGRLKKAG